VITPDEFFREIMPQFIHDKCDYCGTKFWWALSMASPVCHKCLRTNHRDYKTVQRLQEETKQEITNAGSNRAEAGAGT
jgi:hypothetical protein